MLPLRKTGEFERARGVPHAAELMFLEALQMPIHDPSSAWRPADATRRARKITLHMACSQHAVVSEFSFMGGTGAGGPPRCVQLSANRSRTQLGTGASGVGYPSSSETGLGACFELCQRVVDR